MRYIVTLNNIRVEDGYEMPCRGMRSALEAIKANQPNNVTDNRSIYSLVASGRCIMYCIVWGCIGSARRMWIWSTLASWSGLI